MSSIRQSASSSTLSTSSDIYNSPASFTSSDDTSSFNAAHPPSETPPQYPQPAYHGSSSSNSYKKDTPISNIHNPSQPPCSQTSSSHHHHKSLRPTSEPLIYPVAAKKPSTKKGHRSCMANFDFTYSGLYVSGSQYGRKTLGTGTGAGGSGECVLM